MPEMTPLFPFKRENRQRGGEGTGDVQFLSITQWETFVFRSLAFPSFSQKGSYQEGKGETLVQSVLCPMKMCDWINSSQL